ncbi:sulfite exporter TauE/SafE family protein [Temperatibacter marinus]|uniref:Sulfite exporter TauE/SafE family protein n=1 Tax=Temperatibacter marinus TaxID=1456591 RepID=A0AA52HA98_9PROT|nr:sulfite exporter TauE/SafE family protein [Temperatibacter marinus]WND03397.1 sulfite exporter TauE/SafE family protein [Temperatibacter marinus]
MDYLLTQGYDLDGRFMPLLLVLFMAGLLGSASHCAGMCGPFIMGQTATHTEAPENDSLSWLTVSRMVISSLPYHLGRMTAYCLLAMLAASLGTALIKSAGHKMIIASFLSVAGVLFILSAIPSTKSPLSFLRLPVSYTAWIANIARPFSRQQTGFQRFMYGYFLGFLPCGFLYAALLVAASTGSAIYALVGMIAFTLGTMPILITLALGGRFLYRHWPLTVRVAAKGCMAFNGISLFTIAGRMLA